MNLDDLSLMRALDTQNLLPDVDALPDQLAQAWARAQTFDLPGSFHGVEQIIICGMGGSALGGALVQACVAAECRLPITVWRDYGLPAWAGPETLVIATSHSGHTEETLSGAQAALERGARLLALTGGGQLAHLAEANGGPVWRYEHAGQPRAAIGWLTMLTLGALFKLGLLADPSAQVEGTVAALRTQQAHLRAGVPVSGNPAKRMAGQLMDRIPLIFAAGLLAPVARRWKSQINETAKAVAFVDELPEMDHNAVAGTLYPEKLVGKFMSLFLRSSFEHPRNRLRVEATRQLYLTAGFNTDTVTASGSSALAHAFTSLHFGDYTAYYLAIANGVDPSPVPQIDELKEWVRQA